MQDPTEYGPWKRTPLWLRVFGYPAWRRKADLNSYHNFSEWQYPAVPE